MDRNTMIVSQNVVYTNLDIYQSPPLFLDSEPSPAEICLGDTITLEGSTGFDQYYWIYDASTVIKLDFIFSIKLAFTILLQTSIE